MMETKEQVIQRWYNDYCASTYLAGDAPLSKADWLLNKWIGIAADFYVENWTLRHEIQRVFGISVNFTETELGQLPSIADKKTGYNNRI